jgi:hypothetical protein
MTTLAVVSGCGFGIGEIVSLTRPAPIDPNWTIDIGGGAGSSLIDYSSLYVGEEYVGYGPDQDGKRIPKYSSWCFLRFWPTGHVMSNCVSEYPNANIGGDLEHPNRVTVGRYRVCGERIEIEYYVYSTGSYSWVYSTRSGTIVGDRILLIGKKLRGKHESFVEYSEPMEYQRVDVGQMEGVPYW